MYAFEIFMEIIIIIIILYIIYYTLYVYYNSNLLAKKYRPNAEKVLSGTKVIMSVFKVLKCCKYA
jgi:hypothetical protein